MKNVKTQKLVTIALAIIAAFLIGLISAGALQKPNDQAQLVKLTQTSVAEFANTGWSADTFVKYSPTFDVRTKQAEFAKFTSYAKALGKVQTYEKLNILILQNAGAEKLAKIIAEFKFQNGPASVTVVYRKPANKSWEVSSINVTRINK